MLEGPATRQRLAERRARARARRVLHALRADRRERTARGRGWVFRAVEVVLRRARGVSGRIMPQLLRVALAAGFLQHRRVRPALARVARKRPVAPPPPPARQTALDETPNAHVDEGVEKHDDDRDREEHANDAPDDDARDRSQCEALPERDQEPRGDHACDGEIALQDVSVACAVRLHENYSGEEEHVDDEGDNRLHKPMRRGKRGDQRLHKHSNSDEYDVVDAPREEGRGKRDEGR